MSKKFDIDELFRKEAEMRDSCLITADIENLGDIVALTQEEVAKIKDITPYLRELDHLIWASGLNYAQK